ncbi:MAG TPA: murein biosynthesis integral membrane protein MurJ [Patescibacteria group bacterium]
MITFSKLLSSNTQWLEKQQTSILSAASIITVATIASAISGLLIKRYLLSLFSATPVAQEQLEAFWIAFQIPDMMFQLIVLGALSAAFIPIFTSKKSKNLQEAFTMSSIMMNTLLFIFIMIGLGVFIFAREITVLRTGEEFKPHQIDIVTNLTRIMIVAQFFFAISNFLTGILQSFQRFIMPALSSIIYNLGIVLGVYFLSDTMGIYSAGVGVVLGAFLHMFIQFPLVLKLGFRYQFNLNWRYAGIGEFFRLMPPRVMAIGASEIRKLLLGFFTTSLGNLSFLNMYLALNLMVIPIRFFGTPISQAALPFLSEKSEEKDKELFKKLVLRSLHQIAFLALPASVLLLILRVPVVRLVFGVVDFPWAATLVTSRLVAVVAISITVQALVQLLIRAFYALKDTRTPLYVSLFDLLLYFLLCGGMVFYLNWGVMGIAVATTITAFVEFFLLLFLLNKKVSGFTHQEFWVPQIKMVTASFFMAVFLYLPFKILDELVFDTSRTIELIGLTITTGSIGMLVYIYFAALFDIHELKLITNLVYSFDKWSKPLAASKEVLLDSTSDADDLT